MTVRIITGSNRGTSNIRKNKKTRITPSFRFDIIFQSSSLLPPPAPSTDHLQVFVTSNVTGT